jgi:PAS domain S-box-containing protein
MEQERPDFSVDKVRARTLKSEASEQPCPRLDCEVRRLADELKKEIDRRRHAEARLAVAQRVAHLGHWDWNIVTNEFYCSGEMYRIFGFQPQGFTVSYLTFLETIHPDDRNLVIMAVNRALFHGEAYSIDHRIIRRDGEVRIVHEQGEASRDEGGNPSRMLGTVQDVTDSRLAEAALSHLGEELRRLTAHQIRVREQERGLVASQLHDGVGQTLIAALMQVNAIRKELAGSRAGILKCETLEKLMKQAVEKTRRLSSDLRPSILDHFGLQEVLDWLGRDTHQATGVSCNLTVIGKVPEASNTLTVELFRISQEALMDALQQPQVSRIEVRVGEEGSGIRLEIEDDGEAAPESCRANSVGAIEIRERARELGGKFEMRSAPTQKTVLSVWLPLLAARSAQISSKARAQ